MRRTDFCNRPTIRAPSGLPDSQVRPAAPRDPRGPLHTTITPACPRPMASGAPLGEASLDGEPSASALPQPVPFRARWVSPVAPVSVVPRGPGGASIECSSALHLPTAAFSTASRACDVASDALCRCPSERTRPFGQAFSTGPPGAAPAAVSSKTTASSTPGRLPSTSALSLAGQRALSRARPGLAPPSSRPPGLRRGDPLEVQDHRQPATVLPALPP
jgi:hypothetical protein